MQFWYTYDMKFEHDAKKSALNLEKHGLPLEKVYHEHI